MKHGPNKKRHKFAKEKKTCYALQAERNSVINEQVLLIMTVHAK